MDINDFEILLIDVTFYSAYSNCLAIAKGSVDVNVEILQ